MTLIRSALLLAVIIGSLNTIPAVAQNPDTGTQGHDQMPMDKMEKSHRGMGNMMGMHMMKATVSSVDKKTGIVKVNAGGMDLTVHFPPDSLASVNPGDTITLHMGFSKQ